MHIYIYIYICVCAGARAYARTRASPRVCYCLSACDTLIYLLGCVLFYTHDKDVSVDIK